LGHAIKGFKNAMSSCEQKQVAQKNLEKTQNSGDVSTSASD
jgi:Sec-independent protein translocase protein TatA